MAVISIKNLRLRTIIGIFDYEREHRQDIVINMKISFDDSRAAKTDNIDDTVDYKKLTKRLIAEVEKSEFYLLEKLADFILRLIMDEEKIISAKIKVDKPHALRYADSVAIEKTVRRKHEPRHN